MLVGILAGISFTHTWWGRLLGRVRRTCRVPSGLDGRCQPRLAASRAASSGCRIPQSLVCRFHWCPRERSVPAPSTKGGAHVAPGVGFLPVSWAP